MGTDRFSIPAEMNVEENRLKSFDKWTVSFIQKEQLALLGFYWVGISDIVKCFFCHVEIGFWGEEDDVLAEHMKFSRYCDLICRRPTTNIPLCATSLNLRLPPAPAPDEYGWLKSHTGHTVSEGSLPKSTLEKLEHEKMDAYCKKYGLKLVKADDIV